MLRLDRSRRAGRFLAWKVRIFSAGAVLALAGIYLDDSRLTGVAIIVLVGGVVLRFLPGGGEVGSEEEDDQGSGPS